MTPTTPTLPDIARAIDALRAGYLTLAERLPPAGADARTDPADLSPEELLRDGALSVEEAVRFSSLSTTVIEDMVRDELVPSFKLGRMRYIPRLALSLFLARVYREWREAHAARPAGRASA